MSVLDKNEFGKSAISEAFTAQVTICASANDVNRDSIAPTSKRRALLCCFRQNAEILKLVLEHQSAEEDMVSVA